MKQANIDRGLDAVGAPYRLTGMNTGALVADPSGPFHPVKSNIQQQRLTTPPCGVPSSVGANRPFSTTPAFSQSAISPLAGNVPSRLRR